LTAAVLELATGATARALAISVATSLAHSALLAILGHAPLASSPAPLPRTVTDRPRKGGRARPRVSGARSRRESRARRASGHAVRRGPGG
jgi:hypothetical protein